MTAPPHAPEQAAPAAPTDLDELRHRARAFLAQACPPADQAPPSGGFDLVVRSHGSHDQPLEEARAFQRALAAAGLAGLSVPAAYGGQGLGRAAERVLREEARRVAVPNLVPISVGLGLALPTLLRFGSEEAKASLVPRILDASHVWCQLFSEPEAGSDLASLRARATPAGPGRWAVTGQKVWSSFAQQAAYALLLARTGEESGRRGITMFALPMDRPGITVRPLREITGGAHFNEVFLDGVPVGADDVIGEVGDGWAVAMATLGNERSLGLARAERPRWEELAAVATAAGRRDDPHVRQRIVEIYILERLLRLTARRASARSSTGVPGATASVGKLAWSQLTKRAAEAAVDVAGPRGVAWPAGDADGDLLSHVLLGSRAASIAGGTDEVQRNVIGERVLGLPKEEKR